MEPSPPLIQEPAPGTTHLKLAMEMIENTPTFI